MVFYLLNQNWSLSTNFKYFTFFSYAAIYDYIPQKIDEIELRKGDLYLVYEKCQDGWFKGASLRTGITGVFPGNYVQLAK